MLYLFLNTIQNYDNTDLRQKVLAWHTSINVSLKQNENIYFEGNNDVFIQIYQHFSHNCLKLFLAVSLSF